MRRGGWLWATGLAILALVLAAGAWRMGAFRRSEPPPAIGGPFHLIDQRGAPADERILKGKWSAVYFGYSFCPDACPTTLAALAQAIERLGPKGGEIQVLFITVDPARDTPSQLKTYLSNPSFPKGAIGLTGAPAEVARAARAYRVWFKKSGAGADYSVDHTSVVYLMDPRGRFSRPIAQGASPEETARQLSEAMR